MIWEKLLLHTMIMIMRKLDNNGTWNTGWNYRNDGVDIEACTDLSSNGFNVGWIETGDWLKYTVKVLESGIYKIQLKVSAPSAGGKIILSLDGQNLTPILDVPVTGGWQNWQNITADSIYIPAGNHTLQTRFFFGGFNFSYMDFVLLATGIEDEKSNPLSYKLQQNFPNPFNPVTTIKYSIPQPSNVLIKVYDIMGNEITTLVNEFLDAGDYQVNFGLNNLYSDQEVLTSGASTRAEYSSGIYFYSIRANNFTSTKKMLLIK